MASKKSSSSWVGWLIVLLVMGGGIYGWRLYSKGGKSDTIDYKTNTVTRGEIVQAVTANGQIVPVKSVIVGTQVSGIVKEVMADFNTKVTNGMVVAKIDPSTFEQNIAQAEAELASAQASLEYAELNHKRAKELLNSKLISTSDYEKTVVELHQAEATAKIRQAMVNKAKVDLERTTIYAPIDGVVISRNVDVGQTVAASFNTPTLFQIANDLSKMQIEAMVSEADVGEVSEGQLVNFTVDAFRNRTFKGTVRQVRYAPITNQNVVNYISVVDVSNPDFKLRPGMTANASIVTASKQNVLKVASAALNFRPPPTAIVIGKTNSAGAGTNRMAAARGERGGGEGGPGGGGAGVNRDEMRKRWESMTPEQREEMRARRGGGGGGGGRPPGDGPVTKTVYVEEKVGDKVALKAITVKAGVSDGSFSEIVEGLKEGDVVVTGINLPASGSPSAQSPMGGRSPFGGGGGFRPR